MPVCENCGAFDTLAWKTPPHGEDSSIAGSAMLPLLVGGEEEAAAAPEPEEPPAAPASAPPGPPEPPSSRRQPVDDAELASVADRARAANGG